MITADLNSIKLGSIMMIFGMIALIMGYRYGNRAKELHLQEAIAKGVEIGMKKGKRNLRSLLLLPIFPLNASE